MRRFPAAGTCGCGTGAITVSLLILGTGASKNSFALEESKIASGYAESCTENALEKIRKDNGFTGSGSINFTYGSCSFNVIDLGGSSRQIISTGTKSNTVKKIKTIISALTPKITISSKLEVPDF